MSTANSGAVFFLGTTRAHYQVLQQPETRFDVENANSTESVCQNPSQFAETKELDNANYTRINGRDWKCCDNDNQEMDIVSGIKRRANRRSSETVLCEREEDMKPALLNSTEESCTQKQKPSRRRIPLLQFLTSLSRRKRRLPDQIQYLQHLESILNTCTYRESCRCLDCQNEDKIASSPLRWGIFKLATFFGTYHESRYFECDESEGYSSDESECAPHYEYEPPAPAQPESDDDDEVFVDNGPGDNTSTDLLISTEKMSVSTEASESADVDTGDLELEVAAGTPVLLNYLLTHPITCCVQSGTRRRN